VRVSGKKLPECGLYKTTKAIGNVEAGRLVYFHNHGDPGPGVYTPAKWHQNRCTFNENGTTVPADFDPSSLEELAVEGFYRVTADFHCCDKQCTKFETDVFVQLGYNGNAAPILFTPELTASGIKIPERGSVIDLKNMKHLTLVRVAERQGGSSDGGGGGGGGKERDKNQPEIKFPRGGFVVH
jgi:hypothetical protein